jgi:hypothetical protein
MANEKLKAMLGPDAYEELMATLEQSPQAKAMAAAVQPEWQKALMTEFKSFMNWFGGALLILPDAAPAVLPQLQDMLHDHPSFYKWLVNAIGVIVIIRGKYKEWKTNKDKAAALAVSQGAKP